MKTTTDNRDSKTAGPAVVAVGQRTTGPGATPPAPSRLWPSRDPSISHPGRRFYQGQWRTEEAIARKLAGKTDNARRVGTTAMDYVGMAPSAEAAAQLNAMAAEFGAAQRARRPDELAAMYAARGVS